MKQALREFGESLRLLRTRRFGVFWTSGLLSNIGTWAQLVAEPWLLLTLGASPFLVGLDAFAMSAPGWLLTPIGGWLADHHDRRRVIALFQSIQMLCPSLIVVLLLAHAIRPWMVILASLVVGITDALSMPSFQSIVPTIVPRDQIGRGLALNSTQFNLSRILGPAIAGLLMAWAGAVACFALNALSYVPFIGVALWILPRHETRSAIDDPAENRGSFAGLARIARMPHVRGALLTVFATGLLCGPLVTFAPVLVKSVFHAGVGGLGLAMSAFGLGGLIGAIALLGVPPARARRRRATYAALAYGVLVVFAARTPWFWVLPVLLTGAGVLMTISNVSANSLLQGTASRDLLGRTVGAFMLAMQGGLALGSLLTGLLSTWLGVRDALLLDGALAILAHGAIGRAWLRAPLPPTAPVEGAD